MPKDSSKKKNVLSNKNPLVAAYLARARKDLHTCAVLLRLSIHDDAKSFAELPKDFEAFNWATVCAYYAAYAAICGIGHAMKTKIENHGFAQKFISTRLVKLFPEESLKLKGLIYSLYEARLRANYNVSVNVAKEEAERAHQQALDFVNICSRLLAAAG